MLQQRRTGHGAAAGAAVGVLVLSEFAGAAAELDRGALVVNPYDSDGVAAAPASALRMSRWRTTFSTGWVDSFPADECRA